MPIAIMFLSTKTQNTHQMTSGLLEKISKLRGINCSLFPIKLAQQNYLMMRSKRFRECLIKQEQKNTQLQNHR